MSLSSAAPRRLTQRQRELFEQLVALYLAHGFLDYTIEQTASMLRCSKSTIYALAASREQLIRLVVVEFFRWASERVDAQTDAEADPLRKIETYLRAVAEALAPASTAFMEDVAAFAPAREVYELNTRAAAQRVRELIDSGVSDAAFRPVAAAFVANVVSATMVRIQRGEVRRESGLSDSEAYAALAELVVNGIRSDR